MKFSTAVTACCLILASGVVSASSSRNLVLSELVPLADRNHDRKVSLKEANLVSTSVKLLSSGVMDTDSDGRISRGEVEDFLSSDGLYGKISMINEFHDNILRMYRVALMNGSFMRISSFDKNHFFSFSDILSPSESLYKSRLFAIADKNKDRTISEDELSDFLKSEDLFESAFCDGGDTCAVSAQEYRRLVRASKILDIDTSGRVDAEEISQIDYPYMNYLQNVINTMQDGYLSETELNCIRDALLKNPITVTE